MRSSRLSQETAKLFGSSNMPHHSEPALRRSTRTSLSRFAYRESSTSSKEGDDGNEDANDLSFGSDIEDAIKSNVSPSPPPPPEGRARKRKRTTTTTKTTVIKPDNTASPKIKIKTETETTSSLADIRSPPKPRKARKPARTTTDPTTGTTSVEPPSDWEEMYRLVKEMRLTGPAANAAVDTMGCERLALASASPRDRRFHTLVALMLSSQTKDTVNAVAMARMQAEMPPYKEGAPPGLNLENMLAVDPAKLNEMIWQVGFHNNKTKYLKQAAEILRDKYDGDIPPTVEGLTSLPGVGPKMAYLCVGAENGWNRVEGIGVDVHVHRITNLWGWHTTKTPEETRAALQAWLPRDRWKEINWLLVGFGQKVCLPVGRRCGECELGLRGLCRAAERKKVLEGRRVRAERGEEIKLEGNDGTVVKTEDVVVEETALRDVVVNEEVPSALDDKEPARSRRRLVKTETTG